jgi:hypothetical protein
VAARYRVGTGGNWNNTAYWSTSSGGSGGASVPGAADDAYIDGSTPVGTVTLDVAVDILSLVCTGWTGTLDQAGYQMNIAANWLVPSGMTFTHNGLVVFDGSAVQTVTMDAASNSFDDLQGSNTSADIDLGSDIRTTGLFTIDAGCRFDLTAGAGYDVYIRGSGTPLVLNGWMYALARAVVFEVDGGGTTYVPQATGWNTNGSLTGAVLSVEVVAAVTSTIRLAGNLSDILIFRVTSSGSGSGATVAFYTDNYSITCSVNLILGPDTPSEAAAFTSYWGSSLVQFTNTAGQFLRWQWDAATHNLQTATFRGMGDGNGGTWSVYGPSTGAVDTAQTFNVGTSTVLCRDIGEVWMGLGSHDGIATCYNVTMSNPGGVAYIYTKLIANILDLADNGSSAETSVECQAAVELGELEAAAVYASLTFEFYEVGLSEVDTLDIGGSASFDLLVRSRVATSQADVALGNGGSASYVDVQDNALADNIMDVSDGTSTNSGNNRNWRFTDAIAAWARQATQIAGL